MRHLRAIKETLEKHVRAIIIGQSAKILRRGRAVEPKADQRTDDDQQPF
jgi:hypothetical protein